MAKSMLEKIKGALHLGTAKKKKPAKKKAAARKPAAKKAKPKKAK